MAISNTLPAASREFEGPNIGNTTYAPVSAPYFFIVSPKFKKYNGQKIEIKNIKPTGDDQYIVQTDLNLDGPNSAPYNVDYRIKYVSGKFKIRDIIAEGVSMMTTQRSDFSSIVSSSGIEALRQELIKKSESSGS